jgi:hypothetical protein
MTLLIVVPSLWMSWTSFRNSDAVRPLEKGCRACAAGSLSTEFDEKIASLRVGILFMGYSNGEQFANCEAAGIVPYVPVMRTVNNQGDGTLFGRADPSPMNRTAIPISVLATRGCRARIRIIKIVT